MARQQRIGIVMSNKMDKSVVVAIEYRYKHRIYSKVVVKTRNYMAHDGENICNVGDKVLLEESRPLSKKKRWTVKGILSKSLINN